jgi:hypothetical protein
VKVWLSFISLSQRWIFRHFRINIHRPYISFVRKTSIIVHFDFSMYLTWYFMCWTIARNKVDYVFILSTMVSIHEVSKLICLFFVLPKVKVRTFRNNRYWYVIHFILEKNKRNYVFCFLCISHVLFHVLGIWSKWIEWRIYFFQSLYQYTKYQSSSVSSLVLPKVNARTFSTIDIHRPYILSVRKTNIMMFFDFSIYVICYFICYAHDQNELNYVFILITIALKRQLPMFIDLLLHSVKKNVCLFLKVVIGRTCTLLHWQ